MAYVFAVLVAVGVALGWFIVSHLRASPWVVHVWYPPRPELPPAPQVIEVEIIRSLAIEAPKEGP